MLMQSLPYYCAASNEVEIFDMAWRENLPVALKGPTGCGKTRFVNHMAAALDRPVYTVACHDDLTAADLVGRHLIGSDGTYWQDGPLTRAVREGAICYLDEITEARRDTTVVIHSLTDDRRILPLDRLNTELTAAPGFMLVISYNPGYQNLLKGLKPSTRQRFVTLSFDYPAAEQEVDIVVHETSIDRQQAQMLVEAAKALRRLQDYDIEQAPSTRLLINTANLIRQGLSMQSACRAGLLEPLSDDPAIISTLLEVTDVCLRT